MFSCAAFLPRGGDHSDFSDIGGTTFAVTAFVIGL